MISDQKMYKYNIIYLFSQILAAFIIFVNLIWKSVDLKANMMYL